MAEEKVTKKEKKDNGDYRKSKNTAVLKKFRKELEEMPEFFHDYMRAKEAGSMAVSTRYAYLIDIRVFLNFLKKENPLYRDTPLRQMGLDVLENVTSRDLVDYMNYLTNYEDEDSNERTNDDLGKRRKMASLSGLYTYLCREGDLKANPVSIVDLPKLRQKEVRILKNDEVRAVLSAIETGRGMTESARKRFHEVTRYRDVAIVTLLLSSGIRVSELVGLNMGDIDFHHPLEDSEGNIIYEAVVTRKGGNRDLVFLPEYAVDAIRTYIGTNRKTMMKEKTDEEEPALFLSLRGKRISVGSVEALVKKYGKASVPTKRVHPHMLRRTRGTNLYNETNDIKLTAAVLGDKSIEVVNRHYIAGNEQGRKDAAYKGLRLDED